MSARETAERLAGHAWHWSQAELVNAIEAVLVAERERAAKVAERFGYSPIDYNLGDGFPDRQANGRAMLIAAAIRAGEEG